MRKNSRLPGGVRGAVAAHGGEQKGPEVATDEKIDDRMHDLRKVRNSPAAHANRDPRARTQTRGKAARHEFAIDGSGNIGEPSMREMLPDGQEHGQ